MVIINWYPGNAQCPIISTGLRQGMIRAIKDENYFGRYGLGPAKNKEKLDVPIPQKLKDNIDKLVGKNKFIFSDHPHGEAPLSENKIRDALYKAFQKIGINAEERKARNIDFHSWRHFFNTYCKRLNIQDDKIQKVTGHKSTSMVAHYTHFELEDYQEVAKAQEQLLG